MLFITSGCTNMRKTETTDSEITSQESINTKETNVLKPNDSILPKVVEEVMDEMIDHVIQGKLVTTSQAKVPQAKMKKNNIAVVIKE